MNKCWSFYEKIINEKRRQMNEPKTFEEWLSENLKNREEAIAYLNAAIEELIDEAPDSKHAFTIALRQVIQAQSGIAEIAEKARLGRESLYKTLAKTGNPKWNTVIALITALGFKIRVE